MQPTTLDAYQLLHDGVLALARAERNGLRVDVQYCQNMQQHLTRQVSRLERTLHNSELFTLWRRTYGQKFNMGSGAQLSDILYSPEHLNITPEIFTESNCPRCKGEGCGFCHGIGKNPSVDAEALEACNIDIVKDMLRIRELAKARDTYLTAFIREQVDGILHTVFNLHLVISYRSSSDSPNIQNIPTRNPEIKKICRTAIKARPGHKLLCGDFKGVEVVVAACYHQDPTMLTYIADKSKDMHRDMAMECYIVSLTETTKNLRHSAKGHFVFAQFYGDWYKSCATTMWAFSLTATISDGTPLRTHLAKKGIKTYQDFEDHIQKVEKKFWGVTFPKYTDWKERWVSDYHKKGYYDTLTGFRCTMGKTGPMDRKQAVNYPIQGSAFHCALQSIIWTDELMIKQGWDSFIAGQIHDELIMDVHPDEEQMVIDTMTELMTVKIRKKFPWLIAPLEVEWEASPIDGTWYDKSEKHVLR